jgi:hypothetical protein
MSKEPSGENAMAPGETVKSRRPCRSRQAIARAAVNDAIFWAPDALEASTPAACTLSLDPVVSILMEPVFCFRSPPGFGVFQLCWGKTWARVDFVI